jgi:hypothetical protein
MTKKRIRIYLPLENWKISAVKPNIAEMLYTYKGIREKFEEYANNWFNKVRIIKPVINLFFAIRNNPNLHGEIRFINMTQALEAFHDRLRGGKFIEDDEYIQGLYKMLCNVIPSELDESFKQSLINGRLKYANNYSMKKRFILLFNELYTDNYISIFTNEKEIKQYIERINTTRNYLTHYSKELEGDVFTNREMSQATQLMIYALEVLLLKEIGMEKKLITSIIKNYNRRVVQFD